VDLSVDSAEVFTGKPRAAAVCVVGKIAVGQPVNGIVEIGGPEQFRIDELVRRRLASLKDHREVIVTQMHFTLGRNSARKHWFRALTHNSARPVSKLGSLSLQRKFRLRLRPQASQR
jgi:hypothetical protein